MAWENNAIGVVSNDVLDYAELKKQGVSFIGAFATKLDFVQPGMDAHTVKQAPNVAAIAEGCYQADIPVFFMGEIDPYYYVTSTWGLYPAIDKDIHVTEAQRAMKFKKFYRFGGSLEKYLKSYVNHVKLDQGLLKPADITKEMIMEATWLSNATKLTLERFGHTLGWPIFIRTRQDMIKYGIDLPGADMSSWLPKGWLAWTCRYFNYPGTPRTVTWEEMRASYLPPETFNPNTISLFTNKWWVWEFTGNYVLPGTNGKPVRLAMYNGPEANLYTEIGFTPKNPGGDPGGDPGGEPGGEPGGGTVDLTETNKLLADILQEVKTSREYLENIAKHFT